jgi:hypothetical protein
VIKIMLAVNRRPGMSRPEFFQYLTGTHGPLVLGVPEFLRHLKKYVQNLVLDGTHAAAASVIPSGAPERDAVIELWFDSVEALGPAFREPRYGEIIRPDEEKFANQENLLVHLVTEETVLPSKGEAPRIKRFRFLRRKPGISREDFLRHWREAHTPLLMSGAVFADVLKKHVRNHRLPSETDPFGGAAVYDGIDEFWFDSLEDVARLDGDLDHAGKVRTDEARFLEQSMTLTVVTRERTVYDPAL